MVLYCTQRTELPHMRRHPKKLKSLLILLLLQNNFLEKDINNGFKMVGFKPKRNYTMHKGTSA